MDINALGNIIAQTIALAIALSVILTFLGKVLPQGWTFTRICQAVGIDLVLLADTLGKFPKGPGTTGIIFIVLLLTGCGAPLTRTVATGTIQDLAELEREEHCRALDADHQRWETVAVGSAVFAGGSGLGAVPVKDEDNRAYFAVGALTAAALVAVSTYEANAAAARFTRDCGGK